MMMKSCPFLQVQMLAVTKYKPEAREQVYAGSCFFRFEIECKD